MISGSPAVRRKLEEFELGQIWISDDAIGKLADEQWDRMKKETGTTSIPLHLILAGDGTILARVTYSPTMTPEDYVEFLARGLERHARWKADQARK